MELLDSEESRKISDAHGNLSNKRKKSSEFTNSNGNLANLLTKKRKKSNETTEHHGNPITKKRRKSDETTDPHENQIRKKRRKSNETTDPHENQIMKKRKSKLDPNGNPFMKKRKKSDESREDPLDEKENPSNQIKILAVHSSFQLKKNSALQICKGKSVMEHSNNTPTEHTHIVGKSVMEYSNNTPTENTPIVGKIVMELSNNTPEHTHIVHQEQAHIVDQAVGIFQDDIIIEILHRLPIRSLHRFKCVSKYWKALISDPYFKKKHFNRAKNDQNSHKFLVTKSYGGQRCTLYSSSLSSVQIVEDEHKLDFPLSLKPCACELLCCCDGLVLLVAIDGSNNADVLNLVLWNPATRESIQLPLPQRSLKGYVCGLGYDATSDDYKILAVDVNAWPLDKVPCEILTLRSGSWRSCEHPTHIYPCNSIVDYGMDSLASLHGAFHWVCMKRRYSYQIIVSFNISNEVYGEIPLLEQMCYPTPITKKRNEHNVSILDGMLCFYSSCFNREGGTFKLWVMKDYGVKESWTLLFTIQDSNFLYSAIPKYRYENGEMLLSLSHLYRLGCVHRTSRGPFELWPDDSIIVHGIVYTESLFSPKLLV